MPTGEPALIKTIHDTIRSRGPISFAWFMEQALYHPAHGYYSSGRCAIGRAGDYFTSVSVGPLFGELLAAQFAEMWESLGQPANFTIVEQGAHHGEFAGDVLSAAARIAPEFFSVLRYQIIEPFAVLRKRQAKTLSNVQSKLEWQNSLDDSRPFVGVHFSNELLDAMPVHLLVSTGDGWGEKFVTVENNEFIFVEQPITDPAVLAETQRLPSRPAGYETALNLEARDWICALAGKLIRGYVLTVDYGHAREDFYGPERTKGTLQCRREHRHLDSPFQEIGRADLTAHVDWTSVAQRAEECGLRIEGFTDQHHFLTGLITGGFRNQGSENMEPQSRRGLQTLLHPELLGASFQFLVLSKNAETRTPLDGFRFAREPRAILGLRPS